MNDILQHRNGLLGTLLIHLGVLLMLLFFGLKTPLPLPPEQGILVNFGTTENGSGKQEPIELQQMEQSNPPAATPEEGSLSQDFEEAPVIEKKKIREKKREQVEEKKTVTEPVIEEKKVNQRALYTGKKTDGAQTGSEGETTGTGNQGTENGSTDTPLHGTGGGSGNGAISFDLAGRNPVGSLPKPNYTGNSQGKVVVTVLVDKEGKVITAEAGARGTTTSDPSLWEAARKAALSAKFDRKSDAPATQKGTITYVFMLE